MGLVRDGVTPSHLFINFPKFVPFKKLNEAGQGRFGKIPKPAPFNFSYFLKFLFTF